VSRCECGSPSLDLLSMSTSTFVVDILLHLASPSNPHSNDKQRQNDINVPTMEKNIDVSASYLPLCPDPHDRLYLLRTRRLHSRPTSLRDLPKPFRTLLTLLPKSQSPRPTQQLYSRSSRATARSLMPVPAPAPTPASASSSSPSICQ
jgi:hypothetical protein